MERDKITFKSKFGYVVFLFVLGIQLVALIPALRKQEFVDMLSPLLISLLVLGFILYLNMATRYVVTPDGMLSIHCGFLYNRHLAISQITKIRKSKNPLSSPAPSLDRLLISYGAHGSVLISPKDQLGFAAALLKHNPHIETELKI